MTNQKGKRCSSNLPPSTPRPHETPPVFAGVANVTDITGLHAKTHDDQMTECCPTYGASVRARIGKRRKHVRSPEAAPSTAISKQQHIVDYYVVCIPCTVVDERVDTYATTETDTTTQNTTKNENNTATHPHQKVTKK